MRYKNVRNGTHLRLDAAWRPSMLACSQLHGKVVAGDFQKQAPKYCSEATEISESTLEIKKSCLGVDQ